jgi:ABC-2 type transport system ATP-binding protein
MKNNAILTVEAHGLVKSFGEPVDVVNLNIPAGTICGVPSPNGAGKTTTINMLATLSKPDVGSIKIFDCNVLRKAQIVRQLIRPTGQFASIDEDLTIIRDGRFQSKILSYRVDSHYA